ncbi:hypothetical protein RND81_08G087600 [Saponaria officinalis]|uniref:SWIM-type domain-containing protein n=1 Tax=Saponaria officinalis TaxID=3572 RepID=A0AAW1J513_SAPOF
MSPSYQCEPVDLIKSTYINNLNIRFTRHSPKKFRSLHLTLSLSSQIRANLRSDFVHRQSFIPFSLYVLKFARICSAISFIDNHSSPSLCTFSNSREFELRFCSSSIIFKSPAALPNQYPLVLSHTPGGSEEWVRRVEIQFTPTIGQVFSSLKEGIEFYRIYALACSFTPRKYTTKTHRGGILKNKSVVCNRQGFRENRQVIPVTDDSIKSARMRVKITRIGCQAHIRFALENNVIVVDQFREGHNHRLSSVHDKDLQKLSRSLSFLHKQLIIYHSKLNIGPSKSFTICKEYVNGYSNVGASLIEFNNFQRDIKCYIGERDAQLFIDRFKKLFDPTYVSNKYCMVFTPFTGVDYHKRYVFLVLLYFKRNLNALSLIKTRLSKMRFVLLSKKLVAVFSLLSLMKNLPMGCILRTTQRSESANSFFKHYENHFGTLVEFRMRFQTAINQQRYLQKCADNDSAHFLPFTVTPLHLEAHAAIEVKAAIMSCGVGGFTREQDVEITDVDDTGTGKTFKVFYNISTTATTCTCKLFERKGLLCRHIFWVYSELSKLLVQFREKICPEAGPLTKDQEMEMLLGCSASSDITILPPTKSNNKGSGKRLRSTKAQCIEKAEKPKRLCAYCKEIGSHDKRNCVIRIANEAAAKEDNKNVRK